MIFFYFTSLEWSWRPCPLQSWGVAFIISHQFPWESSPKKRRARHSFVNSGPSTVGAQTIFSECINKWLGNDQGISDKCICNFKPPVNSFGCTLIQGDLTFVSPNYLKPFSCVFGFNITRNTLCQLHFSIDFKHNIL